MTCIHVTRDAEQPGPGPAPMWIERGQGRDRLDGRLRGEIGDDLRIPASAGEERRDPHHVGAVDRLEVGHFPGQIR